jgi:hypothetical protein
VWAQARCQSNQSGGIPSARRLTLVHVTGVSTNVGDTNHAIDAADGVAVAVVDSAAMVVDPPVWLGLTLETVYSASCRLGGAEQATQLCQRLQMFVGVAEHHVDHGHALEIVPDLVLHRHANAAVKLNRLLSDMLA